MSGIDYIIIIIVAIFLAPMIYLLSEITKKVELWKQRRQHRLALAYVTQNRTDDEALLAYEAALRIEPNDVSILRALADEGYRRCSKDYNAAMRSP